MRFAEAFHCHLFQRGARSFAEAAEHEEAAYKSKAKEMLKSGASGVKNIKQLMPVLLVLSQISKSQGLRAWA